MELRRYVAVVWKWLWLIVLATSIAAGSTYLAGRSAKPLYQTKTTLIVGQFMQNRSPTNMDFWASQQLAQTYAELAKREPVLQAAVEATGADVSWDELASRMDATVVEGTQLIEIRVSDTDPVRVQALANEVAQQLILQSPTTPSAAEQQQQSFVQAQLADVEGKIKATQEQIQQIDGQLSAATSAREMQDLQGQIAILQAQVQDWRSTYVQLAVLLDKDAVNTLSVVEPARLPTAPVGPKRMQNVLLAAAVGLVLAVGVVFLLEYLDDTIKAPDDVTLVTALPTLGAIARIDGQGYPEKLIAVHAPLSPIVEAYRVLRTNVRFSSVDKPAHTLMVTSSGPSEGKSITLANLAVVLAQSGLKVVAVDTDLRRPVLHRIFGLSNSHGLTDAILQSNPGLMEHVQPSGVERLWVLPSGPLPPNPAELLGSERLGAISDELKQEMDVVLFDSPPSLVVADAAILGARVDGVLLVVDAGHTRGNEARRAADQLRQVGVSLLGVVLNKLSLGRGSYYHHYYYYRSDSGQRRKGRRRSKE